MSVIVVIVIIDANPVDRVHRCVRVNFEKMRVNFACEGVLRMGGVRVDVLKRREEKRQQQCQNRLDCRNPTHH